MECEVSAGEYSTDRCDSISWTCDRVLLKSRKNFSNTEVNLDEIKYGKIIERYG